MRRDRRSKLYRGRRGLSRLSQRSYPRRTATLRLTCTQQYFQMSCYYRMGAGARDVDIYDLRAEDGRFSVWPAVTSPIARRMLIHLAGSAHSHEAMMEAMNAPDRELYYPGAGDLWERLQDSGLAQQLAGGPDQVPVVQRAEPWRSLAKALSPVSPTLETQLDRLIFDLELLLPKKPRPRVEFKFAFGKLQAGIIAICLLSGLLATAWEVTWILLMFLAIGLVGIVLQQNYHPLHDAQSYLQTKRMVLFHYLLQEFSDE